MPKKRLTAPFIEAAKSENGKAQTDYFDLVLPGFGLRVSKKRKSYFVMVRALKAGEWKLTRATLGTTNELTLAQAREQAREAIKRAEQGKAPIEVKQERRTAKENESRNTYGIVREEFLAKYIGRQQRRPAPRTLDEMRRVFTSDLVSGWTDRPLAQISKRDVLDVLDTLTAADKPVMANRTLSYLRLLFKWSVEREIIKADPTTGIKKPGAETSRNRVLSINEILCIWQATASTQINKGDLFASVVKVLLLTGQRRDEVGGMRWSEIDGDTWVLPASRTKNHREHVVPLSKAVIAIIEERRVEQASMNMQTDFVFTNSGRAPFSGWSKSKARLDGRANVAPWTLHDARRSFVTLASEKLHIAPHIVEAIVNHVSGSKAGVAGVYNRAQYLDERRQALDAWADYLLRVVGEVATDNVVELAR